MSRWSCRKERKAVFAMLRRAKPSSRCYAAPRDFAFPVGKVAKVESGV